MAHVMMMMMMIIIIIIIIIIGVYVEFHIYSLCLIIVLNLQA